MHCLDTNIIIDFLRGNEQIIKKVNDLSNNIEIFVTPITVCEIYKGIFLHNKIEEELEIFEKMLHQLNNIEFNNDVCKEFGKIYSQLKKAGTLIPEFDMMIASFVKVNNLTLITRDKKHFEDVGIKVEVW